MRPRVDAQGSVATDRAALEALYDATGGADWTASTNWKTGAALGDWFGVTNRRRPGRVESIDLWRNGLSGPIPRELGNLSNLGWHGPEGERIDGLDLQTSLGNLVNLGGLYLDQERAERSGSRTNTATWANLASLFLGGIDLSVGPLPAWLEQLSNLWYLSLHSSERNGTDPGVAGEPAEYSGR